MSIQETSPAAPEPESAAVPAPVKPGPKQSPAERMNRRVYVEHCFIDGRREGWIVKHVSEKYGISTRMVRTDLRLIRSRWRREDEAYLDELRKAQVKALQRIARKAERGGDLTQARMARRDIAHLLGMGRDYTLRIGGKVEHVHTVDPTAARDWVLGFRDALAEVGLLETSVPCEVLPEKNGHEVKVEGNGHAA